MPPDVKGAHEVVHDPDIGDDTIARLHRSGMAEKIIHENAQRNGELSRCGLRDGGDARVQRMGPRGARTKRDDNSAE